MIRKRFLGLFAAILLAMVATISAAQDERAREKARIGYAANTLAFLGMFVANDMGLYSKQGLEVELIQLRPSIGIAALISGDVDYLENLGSAIRAASRGAPIRLVSTNIRAPFFSLAVHPKFKSVKELKGRTIGVNSIGGTNYISARAVLQHHNVDPDREAKILAIGDQTLVYEALKIGRVDAVMATPPFSVLLKREGFPLLAHAADVLSIPFVGLSTTLSKINRNRSQAKRVLKAEVEALRLIHTNPRGTQEVIRRRFAMDEQMAADSYHVVVSSFSKDGRIPHQGIGALLETEKKDGAVPQSVTVEQVTDSTLIDEAIKELGGK